MISIIKGQSNDVVLTLKEKSLLPNPTYLFEFTNDLLNQVVVFIAQDNSINPDRYNEFNIYEVTGTTYSVNTLTGYVELNTGDWTYNIYEQTSPSDLDVGNASLVETGKVEVSNLVDGDDWEIGDEVDIYSTFEVMPSYDPLNYRAVHTDLTGLTGSTHFVLGGTLSLSLEEVIEGGSIGSSTQIPTITYDEYGRVIGVTSSEISIPPQTFNNSLGKGLTGSTSVSLGSTQSLSTIYNTNLSETLTTPNTVGGIPSGTLVSSLKTKSLVDIVDDLLFPTVPPTYTSPTSTFTSTITGLIQCGVTSSTNLSLTFTQNDAGVLSNYFMYNGGTLISSTASLIGYNIYNTSPTTITLSGSVSYTQGAIKNDNKGNPNPTGRINAGTINATPTRQIKSIFPYFYGKVNDTFTSIDASQILASTRVVAESNTTLTINFNTSITEKAFFAIPVSSGSQTSIAYGRWFVTALNNGNIGGGSNLFGSPSIISVIVNGISKNYNVYLMNYGSAVNTSMQLQP